MLSENKPHVLSKDDERVVEAVEDYAKTAKEILAEVDMSPATLARIIRKLIDKNYLMVHSKKLVNASSVPYYIKISPDTKGDVRKVRIRPAVPGDSPMKPDFASEWLLNKVMR